MVIIWQNLLVKDKIQNKIIFLKKLPKKNLIFNKFL